MKRLLITLVLLSAAARCFAQPTTNAPLDTVLKDGVRVIAQQQTDTSLVAVDVFVRVGASDETPANTGIGTLVASCLLTGTTNQDTDTITRTLGSLGGNIRASWQSDMTQIKALTLSSQFDDTAYLVSDVLKNASFPDQAVQQARTDMLTRLQANTGDLYEQTYQQFRGALYSGTAYSRSGLGTEETIKRFTPAQLRAFFRRYYRPENIVISVVGNIAPQHVADAFSSDLGDFARPLVNPDPVIAVNAPVARKSPLIVKQYIGDISVGLVLAGYMAPGTNDPDYPVMQVVNALLGGMKTSLMFENLRTKKAYGYEVASTFASQLSLSDISGYIVFSPTQPDPVTKKAASMTSTVRDALVDQFRIMRDTPPTDIALSRAKKFLIGTYLLQHERLEDRALYLGYSEIGMKDLGGFQFDTNYADHINAVTAADVQRASQKYFSGAPVVVLTLPGDPNAGSQSD